VALGAAYASRFDWAAAEKECEQAIETNANDAAAHYLYAFACLLPQERYDEALAQFRKALDLDPLSGIINANYGSALFIAGKVPEGLQQLKKTVELNSTYQVALMRAAEVAAYTETTRRRANAASAHSLATRGRKVEVRRSFMSDS
jgi:Tfp pilus assembly protein PilF